MSAFDPAQQQYLQGFASGIAARRAAQGQPLVPGTAGSGAGGPPHPDAVHHAAQDRTVAAGGKLVAEETAKRTKPPFDNWDELVKRADLGEFPKGSDVFLTKFYGLFYVAPAQNSYMCRLRIPNGELTGWQMRGLAQMADELAGGYADVTTRANLQFREIPAANAVKVVVGLQELGLTSRGSGADNIRNITGSATAGIDPRELIDTRPWARAMHHHILNHREMYGLPRKFNIAYEGGGAIPVLEDTNDIGFTAVRVREAAGGCEPGVYFRLALGGITGHRDFARDVGVLLRPQDCVPVSTAIVRAFSDQGDRTDRAKARLKYVLDRMGFDGFMAEVEKHLGRTLPRVPLDACDPRPSADKHGHVGVHPQKQIGRNWIGVVLPVGRLSASRMRDIADIAETFGSGSIRLTVWQNLLIADVPDDKVAAAVAAIEATGLSSKASAVRGGLVACTGNAGCKFAASDTKGHAMQLADWLEQRIAVDLPVNIHLTGCHHSCAQHYIGDIGLIACKVDVGEEQVEGYHLLIGGGASAVGEQGLAREYATSLVFDEVKTTVESLLRLWLGRRETAAETFVQFCRRHEMDALRAIAAESAPALAA